MAILALDLGGTKLAARLIVNDYCIDKKIILPKLNKIELELKYIIYFLKKLKKNKDSIIRCAVASAPTIDHRGYIKRWPNRPYWKGVHLSNILQSILCCPIIIEDDGNAAALAEAKIMDIKNLIYIGLGTGVGGGFIVDGQIYHGYNWCAAEIGHMLVSLDGPLCQCGRTGCLQAYASVPAILSSAFPNRKKNATFSEFRTALDLGLPNVLSAIEKAAGILTTAIITLSELFDPQVIVIGGVFIEKFSELYSQIQALIPSRLRQGQTLPQILLSRYGAQSSLEGATLIAKNAVLGK